MSDGSPHEHVHDVEPDRVIGLEQACVLLRPRVAGLEVRHAVLLWQLLRHILALKVEEDEPAKEEGEAGAEADDQGWVQLRTDRARFAGGSAGSDGDCPG